MRALYKDIVIGLLSLTIASISALASAEITPEEVAKLDTAEFTPIGAERKGNAEGTIPEWTGGISSPPSNWKAGEKLADPYPQDKILFEITAENYQQYQDKLSPGQIALLKRYSASFKMPVYKTRRSAIHPKKIYKEIREAASRSRMAADGLSLDKFTCTTPFPFPKNGVEVIWNHVARFRGFGSLQRTYTQTPVHADGDFSPVVFREQASWGRDLYGEETNTVILFLQRIIAPPHLEGEILLVHETLNQTLEPRKAWIYNAGQRRVRRAPNVAYDGPGMASDGLRTQDDLDLFNGALDRYDWELKGKKELYIPYNAYKVMSGDLKYKDVLKAGHLNPQHLRYELHRVWVVEATLRAGARHVYARRTFHVDEDTWQIAIVDHYDGRGELWKVKEGHALVHYQKQVPWLAVEVLHDLVSGRYLTTGLDNEMKGYQYLWDYPAKEKDYTPAALRRSARR